jgi:hypothetical protein
MNHRPCGAARQPREECALTPRNTWSGTTHAHGPARRPLRFWPRPQRLATLGLTRRVFVGGTPLV